MTKYQSSTSEYVALYGVTCSTIFRWKTKGAPLDNPEAMLIFRANEKSRTRVSKSNHRCTSSTKTSCTPSRLEPVKNQADPSRAEVEKHIGMSAGIKRLQAVEVLLALDYEEARKSRDMEWAKACREEWLAVFEQLRRVEATNPEIGRLKKESVAISDVKIEVHRAYSRGRSALGTAGPVDA